MIRASTWTDGWDAFLARFIKFAMSLAIVGLFVLNSGCGDKQAGPDSTGAGDAAASDAQHSNSGTLPADISKKFDSDYVRKPEVQPASLERTEKDGFVIYTLAPRSKGNAPREGKVLGMVGSFGKRFSAKPSKAGEAVDECKTALAASPAEVDKPGAPVSMLKGGGKALRRSKVEEREFAAADHAGPAIARKEKMRTGDGRDVSLPPVSPGDDGDADEGLATDVGAVVDAVPMPVRHSSLKGQITDDNANFDAFVQFLKTSRPKDFSHSIDVTGRLLINVVDSDGSPVPGADILIEDGSTPVWRGRTYAQGRAVFLPAMIDPALARSQQLNIVVRYGDVYAKQALVTTAKGSVTIALPSVPSVPAPSIDLCFVLDSTGSMGEEIQQLQKTLDMVVERIRKLPGSPEVRLGMVEYRDRGDAFVTKISDFTDDMDLYRERVLAPIVAGGGGDGPESAQEAIYRAVRDINWKKTPNAIRLVILIADAEPHLDYADDFDFRDAVKYAQQDGIKIHTLGCSGLSRIGEVVFRQIAEATLGKYIFITRGGGGGAPHSGVDAPPEKDNSLDVVIENLLKDEVRAYRKAGSLAGEDF